MASQPVPSAAEVQALLARGNGPNFVATSSADDDPRLRPRRLPLDPQAAEARVTVAVGRGNLAELWRALGAGQ